MYRNCHYTTPSGETKPIRRFTRDELLQAYTAILSSLGAVGAYEPVAEGIRSEWQHRRYNKQTLRDIDRRFKNLRRTPDIGPVKAYNKKSQKSSRNLLTWPNDVV